MSIAITRGYLVQIGGPPIDGRTVLVQDGWITAVGPATGVSIPDDVATISADGSWVLPGLVEAHSHFGQLECQVGDGGTEPDRANRVRSRRAVHFPYADPLRDAEPDESGPWQVRERRPVGL